MAVRLLVVTLILAVLGAQTLRPADVCVAGPVVAHPHPDVGLVAVPQDAGFVVDDRCTHANSACVAVLASSGDPVVELPSVVSPTGVRPAVPPSRVGVTARSSFPVRIGLTLARLSVLRT